MLHELYDFEVSDMRDASVKGNYKACPVSARERARTRLRAFEGPDLPSPVVDALTIIVINFSIIVSILLHANIKLVQVHR